ncbi:hypothetical protein SVIO_107890 [Streptomyces violaceusniger]|uniref:Uncharacterized protein n=1 Tax=Streptomyces violaceusniger TaxID=68280 RepID=A0A4D4LLJ3_STRVO|nr:hypothetical protein SVIO_107890 [Streptomyces violaceusniger]
MTDDAGGSVAARDVLGDDGGGGVRFTGAAARALTVAMEQAGGTGSSPCPAPGRSGVEMGPDGA